jgi:hypothetical protein
MRSKIIAGLLVLAACGAAVGWRSIPHAIADDACGGPGGQRVVTIDAGQVTDGHGRRVGAERVGDAYQVRHLSGGPDGSLVYVRDAAGDDAVVVEVQGSAPVVIPQRGEVMHPSWGADGTLAWGLDDALVVRGADGSISRVPGPRPGGQVVAPAIEGATVVAAVAAGPTRSVPEGDRSDDLWRFADGTWTRLTHFPSDADRWTAIRTPMTSSDGSIWFVVVRGRASATSFPRFALWRLDHGRATLQRSLPGEMYLAGFAADGRPLWNVPDRANARWLVRSDDGRPVGCGAVAVDPMDAVDPDRTGRAAPPARGRVGHHELGDPSEVALLVGDFSGKTAAAVVADRLTRAYAGRYPVDLVYGEHGSAVVRPYAWAVLVRLGAATDGGRELAELRRLVPDLADHTWIVVP